MSRSPATSPSRRRFLFRIGAVLLAPILLLLGLVSPASAAPVGPYTALGDSYASGMGIPTQVDSNCQRSDHNYASVIAQQHGTALTDMTCGGATTVNMTQAQGTNPPQLNGLTSATKLVTLQIGGNDIGFGNILTTCMTSGLFNPFGSPCKNTYTAGGTDQLQQKINATKPLIAAVVQQIHQRSPQAKVLVLGYPAILPDTGNGCWPSIPIAFGDVPYLRATHKALNTMIAQAAAANGATYVDIYTPSIGHDACQSSGRWVEGINLQSPFHPNATGHQGMAAAVAAAA
ncbi:SGNH/GDSL hydrolase family protein [Yinghuangia sp. YIM S10712]|uniref:SGNH/GDSL hydrolase family protein n=1 Tax=Yinghuangia sp. YIM S10712 TaxID=3436930 RepID=UPI003F533840